MGMESLLHSILGAALGSPGTDATASSSQHRPQCAISRLGITLSLLISIVGCTTLGPDYERPEVDVASEWLPIQDPRISDAAPADPRWWSQVFKDPVLDELITTANTDNLTLHSAGLRVLQAQANLAIALGLKYPQSQQVTAAVAGERQRKPDGDVGGFGAIDLGFNVAWEADVWGRFQRLIESASALLDASVANYDAVMVALYAQVAQNYLVIRTLQERLKVANYNVSIQQKSLDIAQARYQGGMVTELDVDQAQTLLENTKAQVGALEITLQQTKNALAVLLGRTPNEMATLLAASAPIPSVPAEIAMGMPQDLIRQRPDIRIAESQMAAQSAQIGVATTELYPSFVIGGSISLGTTTLGGAPDFFSADAFTGNIAGGIQWNIFNYGRLKNNVRLQDATFQQLLVDYQNTVLQAQADVENAIIAYLKSQDQLGYYRLAAEAAQRSVDTSTTQYKDGLADFTSVIQTLNSLRSQQDILAVTKGSVATNLVQVYRALGGGWKVRGNTSPVEFIPAATKEQMRNRTKYWKKVLQ